MNLYDYFKENINVDKIKEFEGDMYDLAIVRYVMKEASRLFYHNNTFFLNKENVNAREDIYNREIDLSNVEDFSIVCNSYCNIIKEILQKLYGIDAEIISTFDDKFRHVDLLITTEKGDRYIVDPLTDLVEIKAGLRTNRFASEKYYDSTYSGIIDDISFLTPEELEKIDDTIGYKNGDIYLDDFLEMLRNRIDDMVDKHKGISDDEKTNFKLSYISNCLNNRRYINGFVDFVIFTNVVIEKLFSEEEQKKIQVYNFFVDEKDLKDEDLTNILGGKETRKRGRVISFNGKNYIVSLNPKALEYDDDEWKRIVEENKIVIRPKYPVQLLKKFKEEGVDRNILHNNEFLREFNQLETRLLNQGKSLEDIRGENVYIQRDMIFTRLGNTEIGYKIEDGHLVIKDYEKNLKKIVFYEDEGRNIHYKTEPILKEDEKVHMYEFDSNGLIELEDNTGIEDLVSPLQNGKYLSRNASYYHAKTYSELSQERSKLRNIMTEDLSKKNFVILEYLSNSSAKVYFEELKKQVEGQANNLIEARNCLEEDCENIVRFFQNRPLLKPIYDLPEGEDKVLDRHIEMDNKQILYLFCSNLKFSKAKHIITPGLGSIFVGPMLKSMYGFDYTNILFSLYSKDDKLRNISEQKPFDDIFSDDKWKTTSNELLLIDDNVGSCSTMNTIRSKLKDRNKSCKFGAIKYNWDFYNQVKRGKLDHPTFDIKEVDFLTVIDDPGYWIMRDSITALKGKGGDTYIRVMKKEGLHQNGIPDILYLMKLAEKYTQEAGIDLCDTESRNIKKSSVFLCKKLKEQIEEITRDFESQNRSRDE